MAIRIDHDLHEFAHDIAAAPLKEQAQMPVVVDRIGRDGMRVAVNDARRKSGRHGRHYPDSFTQESQHGAGSYETVFGPDSAKPQGNMNFEHGPGPQSTPHLSVAISHDAVKTRLGSIGEVYDGGVYQ